MIYCSIDIETSGLNPEKHQILSVGVIIEDTTKKLPFHEIPKFHCAIVQEEIVGGLFALDLNRDLIRNINHWNTSNDEVKKYIESETGMIFCKEEEVVQHLFKFLYLNGVLNDLFYLKIRDGVEYREVSERYPKLSSNIAKSHLTIAGKNFGTFDKLFIEKLPRWQQVFKIRQRIIDPTILFTDWCNDESLPNLTTCKERAKTGGEVTHDALLDAFDVIELMRTQY
jgi:oligoribonuclease